MFVNCIGDRTFGVLTKLDFIDKVTNSMDVRSLSLSLSLSLTHTHTHARTHNHTLCMWVNTLVMIRFSVVGEYTLFNSGVVGEYTHFLTPLVFHFFHFTPVLNC